MKKFDTIKVNQMPDVLAQDGAMLLDCRLLRDYREGHIDDALHAHDDLVETLIRSRDKAQPLVIYCYHGHSSEHLAELFGNFGFNKVYSVEGGYAAYQAMQQTAG
ncbi:rhodanese-like domain-containing protein [Pseudomaricurvus sp. HS19]|uniref:rhodanese-like domain-containing protein n=1 Tax=Pseudomaricurvus sp. HS19 TaxID=2692626 RepID=UPI00136E98F4|nr:rhodanese-like domain-containing protein [Pseudomaricurvus sp. HS19]MYM62287.1 thiosulfate sulfurtransferase GlpE [Pseudomaricurvus sp. HS19]